MVEWLSGLCARGGGGHIPYGRPFPPQHIIIHPPSPHPKNQPLPFFPPPPPTHPPQTQTPLLTPPIPRCPAPRRRRTTSTCSGSRPSSSSSAAAPSPRPSPGACSRWPPCPLGPCSRSPSPSRAYAWRVRVCLFVCALVGKSTVVVGVGCGGALGWSVWWLGWFVWCMHVFAWRVAFVLRWEGGSVGVVGVIGGVYII